MASHSPPPVSHPRRILVRGVNWLGDAVMTTPALLRLRERFPDAHITLLTPEKLQDLWLHHPAVNKVITFGEGEGLFSVSSKLPLGDFDLALLLPNSPRAALEAWLARIPRRIGYARPWRNWFLTACVADRPGAVMMRKLSTAAIKRRITSRVAVPQESKFKTQSPSGHHIHQYLHLIAALGGNPEPLPPRLFITDKELALTSADWQKGKLEDFGAAKNLMRLGLNVGAEYGPAKRWPIENWIQAANEIHKRLKLTGVECGWLLFGVQKDFWLVNEVAGKVLGHRINLCGKTTLRQMMAELSRCRVILTNDTGPMHVAAAVGTPVVVPFGSTSPELTGPGLPGDPAHQLIKSAAPCSPCFRRTCPIDFRCMTGIGVDRVVEALLEVVQR